MKDFPSPVKTITSDEWSLSKAKFKIISQGLTQVEAENDSAMYLHSQPLRPSPCWP